MIANIITIKVLIYLYTYRNHVKSGSFYIAEEIKSFNRIHFTWYGPKVELNTTLYILRNADAI